jgi:hypothetical protein
MICEFGEFDRSQSSTPIEFLDLYVFRGFTSMVFGQIFGDRGLVRQLEIKKRLLREGYWN